MSERCCDRLCNAKNDAILINEQVSERLNKRVIQVFGRGGGKSLESLYE